MAKRGLAKYKRRRRRRKRKARRNPSGGIAAEATETLAPALGAYLVTKFISRVAFTLVQRRWPNAGKHAGALASAATFGGVYYGAGKIDALRDYEKPIVIGSAVAAGANIARTYLPAKFAWIAADYKPADVATPKAEPTKTEPTAGDMPMDEFDMLEIEAGAYDRAPEKAPAHYRAARGGGGQSSAAQAEAVEVIDDGMGDILDDVPDDGSLTELTFN
jgi:hypothetical protein